MLKRLYEKLSERYHYIEKHIPEKTKEFYKEAIGILNEEVK